MSYGHPASGDTSGEGEAFLGIRNRQQRTTVPRREPAFLEQILDRVFELEQADGVRYGGAVLAGALSHLLLGEMEFVNQALKGVGLLDGVEILALEVLNEGHFERHFLGHVADYNRHTAEAGSLGGAPPALAGNQLIAISDASDDERLDDSTRANRAGELVERFLAEAGARLVGAWINQVNIDLE
ncbi:MAG: hypothetical protein WCE26_02400 [Candidatus Acidiferrales bacterium]